MKPQERDKKTAHGPPAPLSGWDVTVWRKFAKAIEVADKEAAQNEQERNEYDRSGIRKNHRTQAYPA